MQSGEYNMNKIKEIRKLAKLTQKDVADRLGITQQAYAAYESNSRIPSAKILQKISAIFNIDSNDLISKTTIANNDINSIEDFLSKSYTAYHTTQNAISILEKNGFDELEMNKKWTLKKHGKYYVQINGSSFIAFKIGDLSTYSFNIAGSHTDSPCLHIKGRNLQTTPEGKRIDVETYGGLLLYSMLDIPLRIAGRVLVKKDNMIETQVISTDFNVNIPSLCIHHNPGVNKELNLNVQSDMLPLIGSCDDLYKGIYPDAEILDADLYCVPDVAPYFSGIDKSFLVSPRIDNLTSVYSSINALINAKTKGISIVSASDNEEVGSDTKQGAASAFLRNVLMKINSSLNKTDEEYLEAIQNGFFLSIDNGHGVHPAHSEKSDPYNLSVLNNGIAIKHHTNYATDGVGGSIIKAICQKEKIPFQDYYNNSDVRSGGTIGLVVSTQLAINSCDIGLAQLGMHSAIETVGKFDIDRMERLVQAFFETKITKIGSSYLLK